MNKINVNFENNDSKGIFLNIFLRNPVLANVIHCKQKQILKTSHTCFCKINACF